MSPRPLVPRWTAYVGIAFIVLMVGNIFGSPSAGEVGDTGQQVIARVSPHLTGIGIWNWLLSLAVAAVLAFAAGLTSSFASEERALSRLAYGGATVLAATALVQHAVTGFLAYEVSGHHAAPAMASALNDANGVAESLVRVGLGLFIGATAVAALRLRFLPTWVAVVGIVCGVVNLVAAGSMGRSGPLALSGPAPTLGLLLFVVWTIAVCVRVLRGGAEASSMGQSGGLAARA